MLPYFKTIASCLRAFVFEFSPLNLCFACARDLSPLLAPALIRYNITAQGADPNAQSMEGTTPYGYVRKRLASHPSGAGATNGSGNGTGGSNANNSGDSLAMSRMLQRTAEVLLELGAYKMERSALAIEQDSVTAQWMKVRTLVSSD